MNPVEQVFPPPEELKQDLLMKTLAENERLRVDLILANQRIVALEARINRQKEE